jgi:hypothetical protein
MTAHKRQNANKRRIRHDIAKPCTDTTTHTKCDTAQNKGHSVNGGEYGRIADARKYKPKAACINPLNIAQIKSPNFVYFATCF